MPRRLCARAPEDVGERLTRSRTFVLTRIVLLTAGWAGAISAATAIPGIGPGGNVRASRVTPPCRRRARHACVTRTARVGRGRSSGRRGHPCRGAGVAVDPQTVLAWWVEGAGQAAAFGRHCLHDVRVTPVQLAALLALLSAVNTGEVSAAETIQRLSRSPHWVWVGLAPVTTRRLTIAVGDRTLAMAQGVVHQGAQVLAPDGMPRLLTDGDQEDVTARLRHVGQWVQHLRDDRPTVRCRSRAGGPYHSCSRPKG